MNTSQDLKELLKKIDHRGYPAYKELKGKYSFGSYVFGISHVQGDPFASPSSVFLEITQAQAGFPKAYYETEEAKTALEDFLIRSMDVAFAPVSFKAKGSGKSGLIEITHCGPEILKRSACEITKEKITLRFFIGLPAVGRTIKSGELEKILFDFLPKCARKCLFYQNIDQKKLEEWIFLAEDQKILREQLKAQGYVAFLADNSILPRKSGISTLPLKQAVPFVSPESMQVSFVLPHRGKITGMGIKKGITLIVGGGYHGKSTLLEAIEAGVYDHIPGDGREYVLTEESALKIRAEDGRSIRNVDISLFIKNLPNKKDTVSFSTENASGSTSQAANIIEGIESGSRLFLIDEDTSATNFMVRDSFMQEVIKKEPITPFIDRARSFYEQMDVSTILVAGSCGDFFHIADQVILMDEYQPEDITDRVRMLCEKRTWNPGKKEAFTTPKFHRIFPKYKNPSGKDKVKTSGTESILYGHEEINVRYLSQIIDREQTSTLGMLIKLLLEKYLDGTTEVSTAVNKLWADFETSGFSLAGNVSCGYAMPRKQELFSCINRFRG